MFTVQMNNRPGMNSSSRSLTMLSTNGEIVWQPVREEGGHFEHTL